MRAYKTRDKRIDALNALATLCFADAEEHQLFDEFNGLKPLDAWHRMIARLGMEVCEAYSAGSDQHKAEELADVIIMCLSIAGRIGIDIGQAVEDKRLKNIDREIRHIVGERRPYGHGG